jgi:hypothetical protein
MDLSQFSDAAPSEALDIVFLHHSVGSNLLASPAKDPLRGGGLQELLNTNNYRVHEATYGSDLGEHTDLFDWLPKFRDRMSDVLAIDQQDKKLAAPTHNRIVMFKSCFPNNEFTDEGSGSGNPAGPELTLANARSTFTSLRDEFAKHPDVLFVYLTAPPLAPKTRPQPLWKAGLRRVIGRPTPEERLTRSAALARRFNQWVVSPDGWLAGYPHKNVVVFDLFGVLTDGGALLRFPTGDGYDSHPSREGSTKASAELVPFLNRSVHRAGLAR